MIKIIFQRDQNNLPRAITENNYKPVSWFLEDDVQSSEYTINLTLTVLAQIEQDIIPDIELMVSYYSEDYGKNPDVIASHIKQSDIPYWEGTGNAHTLSIYKDRVKIYNEYTYEQVEISFDDFKEIMLGWKKLIES